MQLSTIQYIIAQPNELSVLHELNLLWTKSLDTVLELEYLQDFNICVPDVFNPRYIIMYMQERYKLNVFTIIINLVLWKLLFMHI